GEQGFIVLAEGYRTTFEGDTGQIADTAVVARMQAERIDIVAEILAALGIRAFAYAIGIHGLALGRGNEFLVFAIRNTVTIRIAAYTVSINRAAFGCVGLEVELVRNAVTIRIIQHRFRQFHVTGGVDLVVGIIQRVDPVKRFNCMFAEDIVVKTDGYEVVAVFRRCLSDAVACSERIVVLPLLTIEQVGSGERKLVFHGNVQLVIELEGETGTQDATDRKGYAAKFGGG